MTYEGFNLQQIAKDSMIQFLPFVKTPRYWLNHESSPPPLTVLETFQGECRILRAKPVRRLRVYTPKGEALDLHVSRALMKKFEVLARLERQINFWNNKRVKLRRNYKRRAKRLS